MIEHTREVATLGGGCFWCLDAIFRELGGWRTRRIGLRRRGLLNPYVPDVCSGMTGHAEVVQVTFDPEEIAFRDLLRVFFTIHDPTTLNRQGADNGTQYRSIVLYHSRQQKETAESVIAELTREHVWADPIVTQIVPAAAFYAAEKYHQDYFAEQREPGHARS